MQNNHLQNVGPQNDLGADARPTRQAGHGRRPRLPTMLRPHRRAAPAEPARYRQADRPRLSRRAAVCPPPPACACTARRDHVSDLLDGYGAWLPLTGGRRPALTSCPTPQSQLFMRGSHFHLRTVIETDRQARLPPSCASTARRGRPAAAGRARPPGEFHTAHIPVRTTSRSTPCASTATELTAAPRRTGRADLPLRQPGRPGRAGPRRSGPAEPTRTRRRHRSPGSRAMPGDAASPAGTSNAKCASSPAAWS